MAEKTAEEKSRLGRMSRNKGASAERELIKLLNEHSIPIGYELKRNLDQTRDGGSDIVGFDFFAFEVKRAALPNINAWLSQCVSQAEVYQTPVLLYRLDFQQWKAMVRTKEFTYGMVSSEEFVSMSLDLFIVYMKQRMESIKKREARNESLGEDSKGDKSQ